MKNELRDCRQSTNIKIIIEKIEQHLSPGRIREIEHFILTYSLLQYTYHEMAGISNYTSAYIKEIGSQLWQDLSTAMGARVTKKNLHLVLNRPALKTTQEHFPVQQLSSAPPSLLPLLNTQLLRFPDGALPANSPYCIHHSAIETLSFAELQQPGCLIRIKAPRYFGKTSFLHRLSMFAQQQSYKLVYLDFREADETIFGSLNQFLRWFCMNITQQLALTCKLNDYWDEEIGSKISCRVYFERYLLQQLNSPLAMLLDEVNRVFEHPTIALDFLPMLRAWHEQSRNVRTWQKLRMVVAHATEIYVPLRLNQSPFNVGLLITLPHFTVAQVQALAACYGLDWQNYQGIQQAIALQSMVGGHPYLTHLAIYYLSLQKNTIALEHLLETAPTQTGIYRHHLQNYLVLLENEPNLKAALHQVIVSNESVQLNTITAYKLESLGLIQLKGNFASISCELYRLYFRQQLDNQSLMVATEK